MSPEESIAQGREWIGSECVYVRVTAVPTHDNLYVGYPTRLCIRCLLHPATTVANRATGVTGLVTALRSATASSSYYVGNCVWARLMCVCVCVHVCARACVCVEGGTSRACWVPRGQEHSTRPATHAAPHGANPRPCTHLFLLHACLRP